MKIYLEHEGGPSPGLYIRGEKADIIRLSERIKEEAEKIEEGKYQEETLKIQDLEAIGSGMEWLGITVVDRIERYFKREDGIWKHGWIICIVFWTAIAGILYLAYRGLKSIIS